MNSERNGQQADRKADQGLIQLVGFRLAGEEYGIDILMVQEINAVLSVTRVPSAPDFVEGVINLRGKVIPVINLRRKFGLGDRENDKQTKVIVMNIGTATLGVIVDAVSEVLRIPAGTVQAPPAIVSTPGAEYIKGIAEIGDRLLILLDLPRLFSADIESLATLNGVADAG